MWEQFDGGAFPSEDDKAPIHRARTDRKDSRDLQHLLNVLHANMRARCCCLTSAPGLTNILLWKAITKGWRPVFELDG